MANFFFRSFILNMNISFNGIKNLNIKTTKVDGYGFYLNNADNLELGDKYYTMVTLNANLDGTVIKGEDTMQPNFQTHIVQYFDALNKLKHFVLAQKILGIEEPGKIELIMKHFYAPDNLGEVNQATFYLNGEEIPILHRNVLPLYSFLARLTRDILKHFELPADAKKDVELMNTSIAREAEEFIENMSL